MRYEQLVFALVPSYMHNAIAYSELRASTESDATTHGGADALRAKFIEEAKAGMLVIDSVLTKWLKEFDTTKAKVVMNTHAKATPKFRLFVTVKEEKAKAQRVAELVRVKVAAAAAKVAKG
ncbi:hypothetical protein CYMTET_37253 [Cymbomonas tetramitiformis]|uniref:Uncharacterized protein n=1 Tax=Cymbomonas tetramitiformis TaxID=36881 RepID=A0AAE0F662_9CHLO|nr:hypothetical protein CYMTET_37253 [Cymbomonas tetramitiformis]